MATKHSTVKIGTQFRSPVADENCLWRVVSKESANSWLCEVVDEPYVIEGTSYPSDYAGTRDVFLTSAIERRVAFESLFAAAADEDETWWEAQEVGATVHYHNGFGQWVRGVIVEQDGRNMMRSTALVGDWREYDLPRRDVLGNVIAGYHARQILEGETLRPHAGNMFERGTVPAGKGDPTTLAPLSLDVPESTAEQTADQARQRLLREAVKIANDYNMSSEQRLAELRALLG